MTNYPDFRIGENIEFEYKLKKSKKAKHVSLKISPARGLEVVVPFLLKQYDVEKLLDSKKEWIKKNLAKIETIKSKFLFIGHELIIVEQFNLFNNFSVLLNDDKFIISRPEFYNKTKEEIFNEWLKEQAKVYIPGRVNILAQKFGFNYNSVKIKNQITRWGSCSSKKNLSFNYRLMSFNKKVIDYVIIHELCHLREMNHSRNFWQLVEELMPDYKTHKKLVKNLNN